MQDRSRRFGAIASFATLLALSAVSARAQSATSLVSVRGHMATSASITDRFVFHVPAAISNLTIRVPIPCSPAMPVTSKSISENESIGNVSVVESKPPDCETDERDPSGNLYRVLTYQHAAPGTITVNAVFSDVRTDADLDSELPNNALPLRWMPPFIQRYLAPTKLVQCDDERIALLARRIIGNSRSESEAAQAISLWLQERIGYSQNGATQRRTDAVTTMSTGEGICEGWAHLFLALARAGGIPCRYVGGYSIGGYISYPLSTTGNSKVTVVTPSLPHAWVEVWYPGAGWAPYDPQSSAGFVDTHHVPIWTGLDGNSNLPILTWQSSTDYAANCSFAEQESTTDISDSVQLYSNSNDNDAASGTEFLFSRSANRYGRELD